MRYTQAKEIINEIGRKELERWLGQYSEGAIQAATDAGISLRTFEECYRGQFDSDEEFAEAELDGMDGIDDIPSYIHIDWEWTAREIMNDYTEENGHYFRIL